MEAMSEVVQAMLRRVQADLVEDEVARALQGLSLSQWLHQNDHGPLKAHLRKLCSLIGVPLGTASLLSAAARSLATLFQAAQQRNLDVCNRKAWSWVLYPFWRAKYAPRLSWNADCDVVVGFYLSLKINTTTLERDLGELLAQLSARSGPLSATGATVASIMEINTEGPQSEAEFFAPADLPGGPLKPTDFARLCAKLWLQHFGRRFRFKYKSKSTGSRFKVHRFKAHAPGTIAACIDGRRKAASAAAAAESTESFVPGLTLPLSKPKTALPGTRWESACSDAKASLKNFDKHTDRKKERALSYY